MLLIFGLQYLSQEKSRRLHSLYTVMQVDTSHDSTRTFLVNDYSLLNFPFNFDTDLQV